MDFNGAKTHIISLLRRELPPELYYHCVEHTLDVCEATRRLNALENIKDHAAKLLETAALYHDAGMLIRYADHEEASVDIACQTLPGFGYTADDIDAVVNLIRITKLPQKAVTIEEQILCDADLDYLGRDDFFIHSFQLKLEWEMNNVLKTNLTEWLKVQVKFLSEHDYFTISARDLRGKIKAKNLKEINEMAK